jgi:uncharacterized membrane protein YqjE
MNNQTTYERNGRSLRVIVNELKSEFTEFVQTRYQILRAEMNEKLSAWKTAIPLLVIALILALTAFLLLTGALVAVIAFALGPGWALLVVGVGYLLLAAVAGWIGYSEIAANKLTPERTIRVLKQDQVWIQNEARSA